MQNRLWVAFLLHFAGVKRKMSQTTGTVVKNGCLHYHKIVGIIFILLKFSLGNSNERQSKALLHDFDVKIDYKSQVSNNYKK